MKKECKFTLIGQEWTLRRKLMDGGLAGLCDHGRNVIEIDEEANYNKFCAILAHELFHGIAYSLGLTYNRMYPAEDSKIIIDHCDLDVLSGLFVELYDKIKKDINNGK